MKILICCATTAELKVVKEEIKKLNLKLHLPIEYLCSGIGNHLTILHLTNYLTEHAEEKYFVVNVGVCGWLSFGTQGGRSRKTDRIQTKRNDILDSSSQAPQNNNCIQASVVEHLNIGKEAIIPIFIKIAQLGKVISSEVVVDDVKVLRNDKVYLPVRGEGEEPVLNKVKERAKNRTTEEGLGSIYIDMESRGIELVAQHFQFPRLLLKVPIDEVGEETKQFDRTVALEKLRKQIDYKELIEKVIAYIHALK